MIKVQKTLIFLGVFVLVFFIIFFLVVEKQQLDSNYTSKVADTDCTEKSGMFYVVEQNETDLSDFGERDLPIRHEIYEICNSLSKKDLLIGVVEGRFWLTKSIDSNGRILFFKAGESFYEGNGEVYAYTVFSKTFNLVVSIAERDRQIDSIRFAGTSDTVILVTSDKGLDSASNSKLEIFNNNIKVTSLDLGKKSPLYSGFSIVGSTNDASRVYLREGGGDGGVIWGSYYVADTKMKKLSKLGDYSNDEESVNDESGFLLGSLSQSADYLVHVIKPKYVKDDFYTPEYSKRSQLKGIFYDQGKYENEGDILSIRNLKNGQEREIYKHLVFKDNVSRHAARSIKSLVWQDEKHILFTSPVGIYVLDIDTGDAKLIMDTTRDWNNYRDNHSILDVFGKNIVFGNNLIFNMETGKILDFYTATPRGAPGKLYTHFLYPL